MAIVGLVSMIARAHIMSEMTLSNSPFTMTSARILGVSADSDSYPV